MGLDFNFDLDAETDASAPRSGHAAPSISTDVPDAEDTTRQSQYTGPRRRRKRTGLYVKFDNSGEINWADLSPEESERLKRGVENSQQENILEFSPFECAALYAVLGEVETLLGSFLLKIPAEVARPYMSYSLQECGQLAEPTSKVLSKYAGSWLAKYKDEFVLLFMLLALHQRKILALMKVAGEWRRQQPVEVEAEQRVNGKAASAE